MIHITKYKWIVITLLIILVLLFTFIGFMVGFPWERAAACAAAKKYVMDTYGLTPTKVKVSFLFDTSANATITTEELPFDFDVAISRRSLSPDDNDNYLNCLIEYKLTQSIKSNVQHLLDENCEIYVYTNTPFTSKSPKGLSIEDVHTSPNKVFDQLKGEYYIVINYSDVSKVGFHYDPTHNEKNFLLLKAILEKWSPSHICIYYTSSKKEGNDRLASANISAADFEKINSPEDLNEYFGS